MTTNNRTHLSQFHEISFEWIIKNIWYNMVKQKTMKILNFKNLLIFLFFLFIFSLLLNNSFSYLDPDFGWHIKVGEEIFKTRSLPDIEHFDFPLAGQRWVDHEWLINTISYFIFTKAGYISLSIFFALIITVLFILLAKFSYYYVYKKKSALVFILLFQLLGIFAILPHSGIRMQEITALFIFLLTAIIYYFNKTKKVLFLSILIPFFYFWACLHAGYLIGIFILFFFLAVKIIEKFLEKKEPNFKILTILDFKDKFNKREFGAVFLFSLLAVLTTLLTPYGIRLYSFLLDYSNTYYMTHIQEWLPFYYYPIQYPQLIFTALIIAGLILNIVYAYKQNLKKSEAEPIKINIWETALLIVFVFLSLKSRRHFPLLMVVSFSILIKYYLNIFPSLSFNFSIKNKSGSVFIKICLIISLIFLLLTQISRTKFNSDPFTFYCDEYPCGALNFLKLDKKYLTGNLFNDYDWGGYLIWAWPEKKLFIDGRLPQYPYNNKTFLEEYYNFYTPGLIRRKLESHKINLILLKTQEEKIKLNFFDKLFFSLDQEKMNKNKNEALIKYLNENKNWKIVYQDKIATVFSKN